MYIASTNMFYVLYLDHASSALLVFLCSCWYYTYGTVPYRYVPFRYVPKSRDSHTYGTVRYRTIANQLAFTLGAKNYIITIHTGILYTYL